MGAKKGCNACQPGTYDDTTGYATATVVCYPCCDDFGRLMGVLELLNKKLGRFDPADEQLARKVCAQVARYVKTSA